MHAGQISVWLVVHFPGALLISGGNQKEITVRPHCTHHCVCTVKNILDESY